MERPYDPQGGIIPPGPRDFFIYTATASALAAAGTASAVIQISNDAPFFLTALTYQADVAAAALTESTNVIPLVTALITDTGSARQLMSAAVPIGAFMGDGKRPYRLVHPRLFQRGTSITVALTNFSAATTYNLRILFIGFKVFGING